MQSRGTRKRILREATRARIRAERERIAAWETTMRRRARSRLEEETNLYLFRSTPTVLQFAYELGLQS